MSNMDVEPVPVAVPVAQDQARAVPIVEIGDSGEGACTHAHATELAPEVKIKVAPTSTERVLLALPGVLSAEPSTQNAWNGKTLSTF